MVIVMAMVAVMKMVIVLVLMNVMLAVVFFQLQMQYESTCGNG